MLSVDAAGAAKFDSLIIWVELPRATSTSHRENLGFVKIVNVLKHNLCDPI